MTATLQPRAKPKPPTTEQARIIDERLQQIGSSWYALGQAIGTSSGYMSHAKAGRTLITNPETIQKVADALDIDPDRLYIAARRVPPDVIDTIIDHPQLIHAVRKARDKMETQA